MSKLLIVGLCLGLVGCSGLSFNKANDPVPQPVLRADKFKACIVDLSREGIKQNLLREICEATYGSIRE